MEQFTASEVRDYLFSIEERSSRQWLIAHDAELGMLRQFADLLEAQEKAVPVAWMHPDLHDGHPYPEDCLNQEKIEGWLPLYAHSAKAQPPASSLPFSRAQFRQALMDAGVVKREAIDDSVNYDGGLTLDNVGSSYCALQMLAAHSAQAQPPAASVLDIDVMVTRFLGWRLPQDFAPDAGISFKPMPDIYMPHCWPTGTNLFHAGQAKEMILHMLGAQENPNGV